MVSPRTPPARAARLSGAPPGPRQREQRSGVLLDAAAALFVKKGLMATSIDDIALRAGVAKGTFYHYFHDRAAMLEALRARYSQQFADKAGAAMAKLPGDDWRGRLNAWVTTVVREYVATFALHDAIFHDPAIAHRCVMSEEPVLKILAELLADGDAAGGWAVEDPTATSVCMFHSVHGLVDEAIATGADTSRLAPLLGRLFQNMVRAG